MVNSPQYIPGLQMLSPCHSQQGIVIVRSQTSADLVLVLKYYDPSILLFLTPTYLTAVLSGLRITALFNAL